MVHLNRRSPDERADEYRILVPSEITCVQIKKQRTAEGPGTSGRVASV